MLRNKLTFLICTAFVLRAAFATAQTQDESWMADAEKGMARAKRLYLPILFHIVEAKSDNEAGEAPTQSWSNAKVQATIQERFVKVRLRQSKMTETLLKQMKAEDVEPGSLVVARSNGRLIGTIPPGDVAEPDKLNSSLIDLFRKFRSDLFERDLKLRLEEKSKPKEFKECLELIEKFLILEADSAVAALLEREALPNSLKTQVYDTLAALSTPTSAEALLSAALKDKAAAAALAKSTPAAANALLAAADPRKPDEFVVVFDAATQICDLKDFNGRQLIQEKNREEQKKEFERLKQAVAECAKQWQAKTRDIR